MAALPLVDERVGIAILVIAFAGVVKAVTGLGIPVVGTPILAAVYGDLPLIVVIMNIPTLLASGYFVWRTWHGVREAARALAPLVPFGVLGVVLGSRLLVSVPPQILAGLLACVIATFVVTSWLRGAPTADRPTTARVAPLVGFAAGGLQGSSGASGPLITMYLLRRPISRDAFFLAANAVFFVYDATQFLTLLSLGQFSADRVTVALLACVPLFTGIALGQVVARRVDDRAFRQAVLALLAVTAVGLAAKAIG